MERAPAQIAEFLPYWLLDLWIWKGCKTLEFIFFELLDELLPIKQQKKSSLIKENKKME